jgi:hypothetical protein
MTENVWVHFFSDLKISSFQNSIQMPINGKIYYDENRRWSYNGSSTSQRKSVCSSSRGSIDNGSLMV